MVPRSTPASRIHTSSVDPDSASGKPEEKPSSITISTRRCRYTAHPSRQETPGAARGVAELVVVGGVVRGCSGGVNKRVLADSDATNHTVIAGLTGPDDNLGVIV